MTGLVDSDVLLARAELRSMTGDQSGALSDVKHLFQLPDAPIFDLEAAVRLLTDIEWPCRNTS